MRTDSITPRTVVLLVVAAFFLTLSVSDGFAAKRASKAKMLARCEQKALACEQACDQEYSDVVNDNSPRSAQYRACNDKCDQRLRTCRRNVDIAYPARTGGGGGSEGDDGLLLSPD